MTEHHPDLPTSVRFPIERCIELATDYFTSTISHLIAWGILQGYREIALYGIDLVVGTEYEVQKACAEFWLGVAHGRGITIRLPAECALLKHSHRYGYQREPDWGPVKLSEFTGREKELVGQRDLLLTKLHALDGALHEVTTHEAWAADSDARARWLKERHSQAMAHLATIDGACQETHFWKDVLLLRSRGAGVKLKSHRL